MRSIASTVVNPSQQPVARTRAPVGRAPQHGQSQSRNGNFQRRG
jgi:hypothetical protein